MIIIFRYNILIKINAKVLFYTFEFIDFIKIYNFKSIV